MRGTNYTFLEIKSIKIAQTRDWEVTVDTDQYRQFLEKRDGETLQGRVERWSELHPVEFKTLLPELMWEYSVETVEMYIRGHFIGAILLSAATVECALADKLQSQPDLKTKRVDKWMLGRKANESHRRHIVKDTEKFEIDALSQLRNALIHAKAGQLTKMATKIYEGFDDGTSLGFYLSGFGDGIKNEALHSITFVRDLVREWYGDRKLCPDLPSCEQEPKIR